MYYKVLSCIKRKSFNLNIEPFEELEENDYNLNLDDFQFQQNTGKI